MLPQIDERVVFAKTTMAPLRGWGRRGQRVRAKVPQGRWKTLTLPFLSQQPLIQIKDA